MDKPKVVILGGNLKQVGYIQSFRDLGYYVLLLDKREDCPGRRFSDEFHACGYDDYDKMYSLVSRHDLSEADFIFTAAAQFAHAGAASLAAKFGIHYPESATIEWCLDKSKFYRIFEAENIPFPKTSYVENFSQLQSFFIGIDPLTSFYLKSDFSKNPNYVYKLDSTTYASTYINWGQDRYFRKCYVIQQEFFGRHIRLNLFDDNYNVFDFKTGRYVGRHLHKTIPPLCDSIAKLTSFLEKYKLNKWLVKFDVIYTESEWVVLDIGLDPPERMRLEVENLGLNFHDMYVNYYVFNRNTFPI